ncbi:MULTISPECIES: hypothetical protein [Pantoea]|uniref:hypothetical protein n=1 Tax=Pantoea TaxID=53335 RepID=UPI002893677D|nr:hypothetical protein [Pantoea sp. UBA5923]
MEKLNDLFAIAQRADAKGNVIECVNPHDILAIAQAFEKMTQRAEAAEAKLAGLEPTGWTHNLDADAALVMLDRIDTLDAADDGRIEDVKRIIRKMAAALAAPQNAAQNIHEIIPGWKLVPVEPTQEMVDACFDATCAGGIQKGYRAMLAAAPEVK